jgi:hypothetical protein
MRKRGYSLSEQMLEALGERGYWDTSPRRQVVQDEDVTLVDRQAIECRPDSRLSDARVRRVRHRDLGGRNVDLPHAPALS